MRIWTKLRDIDLDHNHVSKAFALFIPPFLLSTLSFPFFFKNQITWTNLFLTNFLLSLTHSSFPCKNMYSLFHSNYTFPFLLSHSHISFTFFTPSFFCSLSFYSSVTRSITLELEILNLSQLLWRSLHESCCPNWSTYINYIYFFTSISLLFCKFSYI